MFLEKGANVIVNDRVQSRLDDAKKKGDNQLIGQVQFEEIEDGLCVQMLHSGSYDDEPKTFNIMEEYFKNNNYKRTTKKHREIYINLSDDKSKLKTTIRFFISK